MVSVAVCAPIALGVNRVVTVQVEFGASDPASWHVVVQGNSPAFESVTLVTGTAAAPLFQSVTTSGVVDVAPSPVDGNAGLFHVMTKVVGVTVVGDGVVLLAAQPADTIDKTRSK